MADRAIGAVVNIGSGEEISIGDLAARITALTGSSAAVVVEAKRERPGASEVERLCADASFARSLGWTPRHGLDAGLQLTIEWVKDNLAAFRTNEYTV